MEHILDYDSFKRYFKDTYKIKEDFWSMDDTSVVDYTGLEHDSETLFIAKVNDEIDQNYNILKPHAFAEKIYKSVCDRYGEDIIKAIFIDTKPLGGKYPEAAKKAFMLVEGSHGFDLYFTNRQLTSYNKGLQCEGFRRFNTDKNELANLLNLTIKEVYTYKEDNKIILIDCWNMSYLTDIDTIAAYLKKSVSDIYDILYKSEIKNIDISNDMSEELKNLGLVVIEQKATDNNIKVKFKFPDDSGDIGIFTTYLRGFTIKKISPDDTTTYLNELCHFVKKNDFSFNSIEDAIEMLHRYISKNK